jgi:acyl-CoA synthetase (NDP forming)
VSVARSRAPESHQTTGAFRTASPFGRSESVGIGGQIKELVRPAELAGLLSPKTIAVIGASRDPGKWGSQALRNTIEAGFQGRIYGVNPNAPGLKSGTSHFVSSLEDIPGEIDCALVALPAARVSAAVRACARRGVAFVVVVASGFSELGGGGGAAEDELVEICATSGMRLLGPNTFGLYSAPAKVNFWPGPNNNVRPGSVGLAAQSGNVAGELFNLAASAHLGFSRCVGIGNQADIGFGEVLSYFADDPHTSAVVLYVEGIHTNHGLRFTDGLAACTRQGKSVFVLKAGRSREGAATALTHTNSLAGDDRVWSAALAELGATRITSTEQAIDCLQCATKLPRVGRNIVVLGDGGGSSVFAVDAIREHGFDLAELSETSRANLGRIVPPVAPRSPGLNPLTVDTPGGVEDDPRVLSRCVKVLAQDPAVDVVVIAGGLGAYSAHADAEMETAEELAGVFHSGFPIVIQSAFLGSGSKAISRLFEAGIPLFPTIPRMVAALATRVVPISERQRQRNSNLPIVTTPGSAAVSPAAAFEMLRSYGVNVPPATMVASLAELSEAEHKIGFPLCLKVWDPAVIHKSDVNGVVLNLQDANAVREAASRLWQRFPDTRLTVMPSFRPGLEMIVGCRTDPTFGPVVLFGRGGIWTEVEDDVAICLAPVSAVAALDGLGSLRMAPLLTGARGQDELAVESLVEVIEAIGHFADDNPQLDLEINPLILYRDGYEIADIRLHPGPDSMGLTPSARH